VTDWSHLEGGGALPKVQTLRQDRIWHMTQGDMLLTRGTGLSLQEDVNMQAHIIALRSNESLWARMTHKLYAHEVYAFLRMH